MLFASALRILTLCCGLLCRAHAPASSSLLLRGASTSHAQLLHALVLQPRWRSSRSHAVSFTLTPQPAPISSLKPQSKSIWSTVAATSRVCCTMWRRLNVLSKLFGWVKVMENKEACILDPTFLTVRN
eukprot:scaffold133227_cov20-Tisochrysis_lutea.AAC.3